MDMQNDFLYALSFWPPHLLSALLFAAHVWKILPMVITIYIWKSTNYHWKTFFPALAQMLDIKNQTAQVN